jgi:SAM-dependent methyltransferase
MLAVGRAKPGLTNAAPIEYVEAPADALPVAAESFDAAVCQQGLQFFPDRAAALREVRRCLRQGGRVGIAVWTSIEDSPVFAAMYEALREATGHELADRYRAGPWGLAAADQLRDLLTAAGFEDVRVDRHTVDVVFEGGPAQFVSTLAASGIAAEIEALSAEAQAELLQAFDKHASPLCPDGTLRSPTSANLALARR